MTDRLVPVVRARLAALRASRYFLVTIIAAAMLAGQTVRFAVLEWIAPEVLRGSTPFLIEGVTDGTAATQEFEVRSNGLEVIRLAGLVAGEGRGALDALLIEVWAPGDERVMRRTTIELSEGSASCCEIRFAPIRDSARRRYRLELLARNLAAGQRLSLWAVTARDLGGLALNGRTQRANLKFDTDTVDLGPLKGGVRIPLAMLMGCFAIIDAAVAWLLYLLVTLSRSALWWQDPRPAATS